MTDTPAPPPPCTCVIGRALASIDPTCRNPEHRRLSAPDVARLAWPKPGGEDKQQQMEAL